MSSPQQLLAKLEPLLALNPDTARLLRGELLALAAAVGTDGFAEVARFAGRLVEAYEASPWKQAEAAALRNYFAQLDDATRRLGSGGSAGAEPAGEEAGGPTASSVGLVPAHFFSGLEWCRLHAQAGIPDRVLAAVEAARNRNRWVETVLETMFLVLRDVDRDQAMAWQLDFLAARRGRLDPDVLRDLLAVWETSGELPGAAVEWLLEWSADEMLERLWPVVVGRADQLLRRRALRRWGCACETRHTSVAYLRQRARDGRLEEAALERWLNAGLSEIEERVQFFTSLSAEDVAADSGGEWRRAALFREVQALVAYFVPVLLLADLLLRVPGGANRFALAFFGLGRSGEKGWRKRLEGLAERAIRRLFLAGLRSGERPADTIQKLCFGDAALCGKLLPALDFATGQFDSPAQRDMVVRRLATHYLNLRGHNLLATEIQRRYRSLMRVLHPDSLGRLLAAEQIAELGDPGVLTEMMAVATAAKRFVERRRDLAQSVEERVAADIEFTCEVRKRRHRYLRDFGQPQAR